jgi:(p)ppGpp synthase/HD superfamily hydrolase
VQIRTSEMHQVAEFGIAAHWKYKEGGSPASGDTERFNWLRQLVDWQKDGGTEDSSDYLASIKEDLFDEEVFVFTPKGDVVGLRKGSTAVDFAYRIHSEVGNHCQGVRINDRLCPLATQLRNGDFVQVITAKSAHPSLDWLNFVATPTARNRIRAWYKRCHREDNIQRGSEMLERELGREGFDALLRGEAMARVARRCNLMGTEDLLASLGFGGVTLQQVVNRLREEIRLAAATATPPPSNEEVAASEAAAAQTVLPSAHTSGSPILGLEGLEYRLGGCCSPLPGAPIVGTVALGNHGITIHRQDCGNLGQVPAERRLPVRWNPAMRDDQRRRYPVQLRIEVLDRVGVLKDILTRLSDHRINVSDARVRTTAGKPARIDLRVELSDNGQLQDTVDQIRSMADVLDIARTGNG